MRERITEGMIELRVKRLNELTHSPASAYTVDADTGRHMAQIGNYHTSSQSGGMALERMVNVSGGVEQVISRGPKRELFDRLGSLIDGISIGRE